MEDYQHEFKVSDKEKKLRKQDRLENVFRTFQLMVLAFVVVAVLFSNARLNQIAADNQKNIEEHRSVVETNAMAAEMQLKEAAGKNRARADVGLCIFSVSPTIRTPDYVKSCYDQIEKESGIKVQRFGDGK